MAAYIPKNSSPLQYLSFPSFPEYSADDVDPTVQQENQASESPSEHKLLSSLPERPASPSSNIPTTANSQQLLPSIPENLGISPTRTLRRTSGRTIERRSQETFEAMLAAAREILIMPSWSNIEIKFFQKIYISFNRLKEGIKKDQKDDAEIKLIKKSIDFSIERFLEEDVNFMRETSKSLEIMSETSKSLKNWREFFSNLTEICSEKKYSPDHESTTNAPEDHINYLKEIIPILENLFSAYHSKFEQYASENCNEDDVSKNRSQYIKKYISSLEIIFLNMFPTINPSIYAKTNQEKTSLLIEIREELSNRIKQEQNHHNKNEEDIKIIKNYIDWLDDVILEIAKENPLSLLDISSSEMNLKKVVNLKKIIKEYPEKISHLAEVIRKNLIKYIKEKSIKILEIKEGDSKDKIIENYRRLELKHHLNTPRITANPQQQKEYAGKLENLKQALRNIALIRGMPQESLFKEIDNARKAVIAKATEEATLNAALKEAIEQIGFPQTISYEKNSDISDAYKLSGNSLTAQLPAASLQKIAQKPSTEKLIEGYLLNLYKSYLLNPYYYFLALMGWK